MRTADRYCDVAGFDPETNDAVFFAHDASACTLVEVEGARTIVSDDDYLANVVTNFDGGIGQVLKHPGHSITVAYESSLNTGVAIDGFVRQQHERARQKGLSLTALIDEGRAVIVRRARHEKVLLALWTRPEAGIAQEVKRQQAANDQQWRALPPCGRRTNPSCASTRSTARMPPSSSACWRRSATRGSRPASSGRTIRAADGTSKKDPPCPPVARNPGRLVALRAGHPPLSGSTREPERGRRVFFRANRRAPGDDGERQGLRRPAHGGDRRPALCAGGRAAVPESTSSPSIA